MVPLKHQKRLSKSRLKSQPGPSLRLKAFAFMAGLVIFLSTVPSAFAEGVGDALVSGAITPATFGLLEHSEAGGPKITLAPKTETSKSTEISVAPDTAVTLNGAEAKLADLESGDAIKLVTGPDGKPLIQAIRSKPGLVLAASGNQLKLTTDYLDKFSYTIGDATKLILNDKPAALKDLQVGDSVSVVSDKDGNVAQVTVTRRSLFMEFWNNFKSNLFKPLLLFFYLGLRIPLLKIAFEFPQQIYQGLTIYLLVSIGWHGGEELAILSGGTLAQAIGFVFVGLLTNSLIGLVSYLILKRFIPHMRRIDCATVAAFYGSDSAGTFVTCLGVLQAAHIAFAAYMPVMLAAMEIPGCLVGLYLVGRLRKNGMDSKGNMPGETDYDANTIPSLYRSTSSINAPESPGFTSQSAVAVKERVEQITEAGPKIHDNAKVIREVFLNPGIILLFGGIIIGFLSRQQGLNVVQADDQFFISLFQGMLCLFLLEMGITAAKRLQDLRNASWKFVAFGLLAPNLFAMVGLASASIYSHIINQPLQLGTYVLFAVLCAAASYIAVPAIQRIAIPEASPTLPLAASLGLTFSYNVTIGIPLYLVLAQQIIRLFPIE